MDNEFKRDNRRIADGEYPRYIVRGEKYSTPFIDPVIAIKWHNVMHGRGVPTIIEDLTEYDWEKNPNGFTMMNVKDIETSKPGVPVGEKIEEKKILH
jgi:hypothetical protein